MKTSERVVRGRPNLSTRRKIRTDGAVNGSDKIWWVLRCDTRSSRRSRSMS